MDFDESDEALRKIACEVFARILKDARERIESVCQRVRFVADGDYEAEFDPDKKEIRVFVSRISDFSDLGKRGILAHEFGHAYVYAQCGGKSEPIEEKLADTVAQQWGFLPEIDRRKADTDRLRGSQ